MDPLTLLANLGPVGAIIVAVIYLQRAQQSSLAELVKMASPSTLTLRIDEEQLEAFTLHRKEHREQSARVEQLEGRLAQMSAKHVLDAAE